MREEKDEKMHLSDHLKELKLRLTITVVTILAGTALSLLFAKEIFHWLQLPLLKALPAQSTFIALNPIEGWLVYFKVSLFSSILLTSPIWFYQLFAFIAPAIERRNSRRLVGTAVSSSLLFACGGLLCYFLILPYGFKYFVSILNQTGVILLPQIRLYLSFMLRIIIAFGLIFQMPLFVIVLVRWKIVSAERFRNFRKYVIVFSFVLAAVITPPDVITQIILALPLILLFELSLLVARLFSRTKVDAGCTHQT